MSSHYTVQSLDLGTLALSFSRASPAFHPWFYLMQVFFYFKPVILFCSFVLAVRHVGSQFPRIKSVNSAVEGLSFNHWTTREGLTQVFKLKYRVRAQIFFFLSSSRISSNQVTNCWPEVHLSKGIYKSSCPCAIHSTEIAKLLLVPCFRLIIFLLISISSRGWHPPQNN